MKKVLNTDNITNELQGASLFFTKPAATSTTEPKTTEKPSVELPETDTREQNTSQGKKVVSKRNNDTPQLAQTEVADKQESMHANMQACMQ